MTVTTKTYRNNHIVKRSTGYYGCTDVISHGIIEDSKSISNDRDPTEYREKKFPLWEHVTALPKASRKEILYHLQLVGNGTSQCVSDDGQFVDAIWYNMFSTDFSTVYSLFNVDPFLGFPDWGKKFRTKVLKDKSSVNISSYVGEYRQTATMVSYLGLAALDILRMSRGKRPKHILQYLPVSKQKGFDWKRFNLDAFNRNSKSRAKRPRLKAPRRVPVRDFSKNWLLIHWAMLPLIDDVGKLLQRLSISLNKPILKQYHAKAEISSVFNVDFGNHHAHGILSSKRIYTATPVVEYDLDFDRFPANFNAGYAFWEGVPFSFLFDYVINVGATLQQVDAFKGVHIAGDYTLTKREESFQVLNKSSSFLVDDIRPFSQSYKSHERVVETSFPPIQMPRYKPSIGAKRLSYILALMHVISGTSGYKNAAGLSRLG